MKVLFCIPLMCGGGAERVMALLCNGLSARGHEVVLATDTKQESFILWIKKLGLFLCIRIWHLEEIFLEKYITICFYYTLKYEQ